MAVASLAGIGLALTCALTPPSATADTGCARARYFLLNRHLAPASLDSCAAALARAHRSGPENEARLALRAQLLVTMGELAPNRATRMDRYSAARAAADSLRTVSGQNPAGHVWWAAAQGRILQMRGVAAAALGAAEIRRANERALALDPDCALASYALGRLCEELPGMLGGGPKRAEAWYRRGVASDPNYTIIRLALAQALARQGRRDEARREIERMLAVSNSTNPAETALSDRPAAQALLGQLGATEP